MIHVVSAALALITIFEVNGMEIYDEFNGNHDDIYGQSRVPSSEYFNDALFKIVASIPAHPREEESWELFDTINSLIQTINLSQNQIPMPMAASSDDEDFKDDSD